MPQEDNEAAELQPAEEVAFVMFPTADQSAEVVEPGEEPLDSPAAAVTAQFAAILSVLAAAGVLVGRDESNAVFLPQALVERIAVVGFIADQSLRCFAQEAALERGFDERGFIRRSADHVHGDRKTMAVCDRHDFTAFSAASRADSRAPFFAELKLASMNDSLRSSLPRSRKSSASFFRSRSSNPERCHCWKRR